MARALKKSLFRVESQPFSDSRDGCEKVVVFSSRTGEAVVLERTVWADVSSLADDSLRNRLVKDRLLVADGQDELQEVLDENLAAGASSEEYYCVVEPTANCQFGCSYCGQRHSPQQMSEEQQRILVERIDRTLGDGDYRSLHIGWFGAEALLALPVLRKLSVQFQNLAKSHGCTYRAKIITNGYALTPAVTRELLMELGVANAVITLDGTADSHDSRRPLKGGRGSFDKIFSNIMAIASDRELDGFALLIRCNVDRSNVGSVSALIRLLADYGLSKRVRFYTAPVHPWGNDLSERILPMEEYAAREVEWLLELDDLGFDVCFLPSRKKINCLTFLKDSVVVGSGGDLYNCTEVSLVPTGSSSGPAPGWIGTLAEGETQSLRSSFGDFYDQVARGEYPCGRCELLPVCGGACPKQWKEGNRPCPSMKFNIQERLLMSFAKLRLHGDVPAHPQVSCP